MRGLRPSTRRLSRTSGTISYRVGRRMSIPAADFVMETGLPTPAVAMPQSLGRRLAPGIICILLTSRSGVVFTLSTQQQVRSWRWTRSRPLPRLPAQPLGMRLPNVWPPVPAGERGAASMSPSWDGVMRTWTGRPRPSEAVHGPFCAPSLRPDDRPVLEAEVEEAMRMSRLGLVVHTGRPEAREAARAVRAWCAHHAVQCTDIDVWHDGDRHSASREVEAAGNPDLIVTLGGDGTFLRGARVAAENNALVLGVDLGRVGFLTEVPSSGVPAALDAVREGRLRIDTRMLLALRASCRLKVPADLEAWVRYGRGPLLPPPQVRANCQADDEWGIPLDVTALNDVVLEKLSRDRQVSVGVYICGRLLASYSADALLVATPTGSTAYSFAAGGPVVSPRAEALVFTPVAPHMAFDRSVVTAPDEPVVLRILERSGPAAISIDGQLRGVLDPGDWIGVYAAPHRLRAVRLGPMDFYGRLRERMNLTDAPAAVADGTPAPLWSLNTPAPEDLAHLALPEAPDGLSSIQ